MIVVSVSIFIICFANLLYYSIILPLPSPSPLKPQLIDDIIGNMLFATAWMLSVLRLPFTITPYLLKLSLSLIFLNRFQILWGNRWVQALRLIGDFFNLILTSSVLIALSNSQIKSPIACVLIYLFSSAELIRLLSEKGQSLFSALWQQLPHQTFAQWLDGKNIPASPILKFLKRYSKYYILTDEERCLFLSRLLIQKSRRDRQTACKLAYFSGFKIVARDRALRQGDVRDIASGQVYIHRGWTNDPWLLMGLAMRRTPWIFDPRFLTRPFYYRSTANRLMTLSILRRARYSPPFAWYQFGHEIKVARYALFFIVCRKLGFDLEEPVRADGTYNFDPLIKWLKSKLRPVEERTNQHPLWSDEELIVHLASQPLVDPYTIASRYAYPLKYVEDILMPRLNQEHPESDVLRDQALPSEGSALHQEA